jgi:hypothetical protein
VHFNHELWIMSICHKAAAAGVRVDPFSNEAAVCILPYAARMTLLDQIGFGTTVLVLLVLMVAIVVGALSILPTILALTGH